jgi:hypothetical protein
LGALTSIPMYKYIKRILIMPHRKLRSTGIEVLEDLLHLLHLQLLLSTFKTVEYLNLNISNLSVQIFHLTLT